MTLEIPYTQTNVRARFKDEVIGRVNCIGVYPILSF